MNALILLILEYKGAINIVFLIAAILFLGWRSKKVEAMTNAIGMPKTNGWFIVWGSVLALYLIDTGFSTAGLLLDSNPETVWIAGVIILTSFCYAGGVLKILYRFVTFRARGLSLARWAMLCFPFAIVSLPFMAVCFTYISGQPLEIKMAMEGDPFITVLTPCLISFPNLVYLCLSTTVRKAWKAIEGDAQRNCVQ